MRATANESDLFICFSFITRFYLGPKSATQKYGKRQNVVSNRAAQAAELAHASVTMKWKTQWKPYIIVDLMCDSRSKLQNMTNAILDSNGTRDRIEVMKSKNKLVSRQLFSIPLPLQMIDAVVNFLLIFQCCRAPYTHRDTSTLSHCRRKNPEQIRFILKMKILIANSHSITIPVACAPTELIRGYGYGMSSYARVATWVDLLHQF